MLLKPFTQLLTLPVIIPVIAPSPFDRLIQTPGAPARPPWLSHGGPPPVQLHLQLTLA